MPEPRAAFDELYSRIAVVTGMSPLQFLSTLIPTIDARISPLAAPDVIEAEHRKRCYDEAERARQAVERRTREHERLQEVHAAAVQRRVEALKRGELPPKPEIRLDPPAARRSPYRGSPSAYYGATHGYW